MVVLIWLGFIALILALLALDLGVLHRRAHVVGVREALGWSAMWVALGLAFTAFIYFGYDRHWLGLGSRPDPIDGLVNNGWTASLKYLTGYVVEKSLSVDNIFVIAMLFGFFAVPPAYQHRVLFWGIMGALVMRGIMICLGVQLIAAAHWVLYIFGAFLIVTAVKMLVMKTDHVDPSHNVVVRLARRYFSVTDRYHNGHFVVRQGARLYLTPLAIALIMIETTDLIFAVDSIPAIFAITADPFLVFTSNVFAILGLRALYFALAGMMGKFRYLKISLAIVLMLVGGKMLAADWLKQLMGPQFTLYLLGVVMFVIAAGVVASLMHRLPEEPGAGGTARTPARGGCPAEAS